MKINFSRVERHRDGQRLKSRAHLIDANIHTVNMIWIERLCWFVWIIIRQRRKRDHFASIDIHNCRGACLGLEVINAFF